jgi:hypothetical protein
MEQWWEQSVGRTTQNNRHLVKVVFRGHYHNSVAFAGTRVTSFYNPMQCIAFGTTHEIKENAPVSLWRTAGSISGTV